MATVASAHENEQSFEKQLGNYTADIGYDAAGEIKTGDSVTFDIKLWNANKTSEIPFGGAWVQVIGSDGQVLFAGDVNPSSGRTGFSYRFLNAGTYTVSVRYEKQGDALTALATTSFPLQVSRGDTASSGTPDSILFFALGCAVGAGLVWLFVKKRVRA